MNELNSREGNEGNFLDWKEDLLEKFIDLLNMIIEGYKELANFRKFVNNNDLESFFNYMD